MRSPGTATVAECSASERRIADENIRQGGRKGDATSNQASNFNALDHAEVLRRSQLSPARIEGPTIIEEQTSTTVLYPGQSAKVDPYLNIEIEISGTNRSRGDGEAQ
jgi:N-methylhydantoinase A/oxoprolinase/acetone carboxylase beta subunit